MVVASLIGLLPAVPGAQQARPLPTVESLGVSFDRIKRQLDVKPASREQSSLKLEYYVEVVAMAPPIYLFAPDEPSFGPVPGTAPSHGDMMRHMTPLAFSSPRATLMSIGGSRGRAPKVLGQDFWTVQTLRAKEIERRKKLEAERERQRAIKESIVVSPPK
jgi:hypothetical protein